MKIFTNTLAAVALIFVASCGDHKPTVTVREVEAQKSAQAAQTIEFSAGNAERENIISRAKLVGDPGLQGYILLINMGKPVAFYNVKGKVTSSGKRLERPVIYQRLDCGMGNLCYDFVEAPSYDGTYGSSDQYIYFYTVAGQYVQWSGDYLYSDQPLNPNGAAASAIVTP